MTHTAIPDPNSSATSAQSQLTDETSRSRRFVFVQLLFSLAIAEVARQVADLRAFGLPTAKVIPVYTHLLLASLVIATSWIGWSRSFASRVNKAGATPNRPTDVFSGRFFTLLLDLLLVIFYFLLVRGAEIPRNGEPTYSARNEVGLIAAMFVGYFVWDFFDKAVVHREDVAEHFWRRVSGPVLWRRGQISLVLALYSVLVALLLVDTVAYWSVIAADVSLMLMVLCFRAWKEEKMLCTIIMAGLSYVAVIVANFSN